MLLKRKAPGPLSGASIVLGLMIGWTQPGSTQDNTANFVGSWSGQGRGTVTATVRQDEARPDHFVAEVMTASGACAGLVEVTGEMSDVSIATAEPPQNGGPVCKIEFRLVAPDRLNLVEMGDCSQVRGFRCEFSAELTRSGTMGSVGIDNNTASADRPWSIQGTAGDGRLSAQGIAEDGETILSIGCNRLLGKSLAGSLTGYSGEGLTRVDDAIEKLIFAFVDAEGKRDTFEGQANYFAPDNGWAFRDLPAQMMGPLARGSRLAISNGSGMVIAEFQLKGTARARAAMRKECGF